MEVKGVFNDMDHWFASSLGGNSKMAQEGKCLENAFQN
jgi:hypothetical protein